MCPRSKTIIPGLVRRIRELEGQVRSEIDEEIDEIVEESTHTNCIHAEDAGSGQYDNVLRVHKNGYRKKMIFLVFLFCFSLYSSFGKYIGG